MSIQLTYWHTDQQNYIIINATAHKSEWLEQERGCNSIKFETGQNLPPVLKIVTRIMYAP